MERGNRRLCSEVWASTLKQPPLRCIDSSGSSQRLRFADPGGVDTLTARCRDITNSQVERFAKGKYIPKLYIRRQLQERLTLFNSSEAELAKLLKSNSIHSIKEEILQIEDYLKSFPLKGVEKERGHEHPVIQEARPPDFRSEVDFLNSLFSRSKNWINKLVQSVNLLLETAQALSESVYFDKQGDHLRLCERINAVVSVLKSMPKTNTCQISKIASQNRSCGLGRL